MSDTTVSSGMNILRGAVAAALSSVAALGGAQPVDVSGEPASPETIREVQLVLKEQGYDIGSVDGRWGRLTRIGVKNFQLTNGIHPTGQLDGQTVSALGVRPQSVAAAPDSSSTGASMPPQAGTP